MGDAAIAVRVAQLVAEDIQHSVGENKWYGVRPSNVDKPKAVMTLPTEAEWVTWSDREITGQTIS